MTIFTALIVFWGFFCESDSIRVTSLPNWEKPFRLKNGWLGGDGLYSVKMKDGKILWFFGDSIFGQIKEGKRTNTVMVNNCVGLQRLPLEPIEFFSGKSNEKKLTAFFSTGDANNWYWPMACFLSGDELYIHLAQIEKTSGNNVFSFRQMGHSLARVKNPQADPSAWQIDYFTCPHSKFEKGNSLFWGSAIHVENEFIYHLGYFEKDSKIGSKNLVMSRVTSKTITDFSKWEFWTGTHWSPNSSDAKKLFSGLASEISIFQNKETNKYILVYTENGLGDRIVKREADNLTGPWSKTELLFKCPEMQKDKGVFCYSAKAHSWSLKEGKIIISYCVNTWDFWRLFKDDTVYLPMFLEFKINAK